MIVNEDEDDYRSFRWRPARSFQLELPTDEQPFSSRRNPPGRIDIE